MKKLVMLLLLVLGGMANAQKMEGIDLLIAYKQLVGMQHVTKIHIYDNLGGEKYKISRKAGKELVEVEEYLTSLKVNCANKEVQELLSDLGVAWEVQKTLIKTQTKSSEDLKKLMENAVNLAEMSSEIIDLLKEENQLNFSVAKNEVIYSLYKNSFLVELIATKTLIKDWNLIENDLTVEISNLIMEEEILLNSLLEMTSPNQDLNSDILDILYKWAAVEKKCTAPKSELIDLTLLSEKIVADSNLLSQKTAAIATKVLDSPVSLTVDQGN
ncbi:MAG: hypothetical protein GY810_14335 [Aureispira sp.]|nr:hypothetical protein [Aureispira sp.]